MNRADLQDVEEIEVELASAWERIGAVLLNYVFLLLSFIPFFMALAIFQNGGKLSPIAFLFLLIPVGLQIYQLVLLSKHGYTLGKKILGIKVIRHNGDEAGFVYAFLLRELVYQFGIGMITGGIYMVMAAFMFSDMTAAAEAHNNEAVLAQTFLLMGVNQILNLIPPLVCVIMMFAHSERRTLQDLIASTVVVKLPR